MSKILVSGSIAHDSLMSYKGRFADHILPGKAHVLSVSFLVDTLEQHYGGTGGNIAYSLARLGGEPLLAASFGRDGDAYRGHLEDAGVDTTLSVTIDAPTAVAHVFTDHDDNQISAFYPGASAQAAEIASEHTVEATLAIIAPTDLAGMCAHARWCIAQGIPYVFDPGQQTTRFNRDELRELVLAARYIIANDYEWEQMQQIGELTRDELLGRDVTLIVTAGAHGSHIHAPTESFEVAAADTRHLMNPTGAGDAYRAGFFGSIVAGASLRAAAHAGNIAAVFAVEYHGTQSPALTLEAFRTRYEDAYGESTPL